jgi:hypothetical protein
VNWAAFHCAKGDAFAQTLNRLFSAPLSTISGMGGQPADVRASRVRNIEDILQAAVVD